MSSKLARVLLLCDQVLLDLRQLSSKVVTLEQCYVGEGDSHAGTADLSDMEIALIQQVILFTALYCKVSSPPSRKTDRGLSDLTQLIAHAKLRCVCR